LKNALQKRHEAIYADMHLKEGIIKHPGWTGQSFGHQN